MKENESVLDLFLHPYEPIIITSFCYLPIKGKQ